MQYIISYTMITGDAERVAASAEEVKDAVQELKAAGAGPIKVETEIDGRRETVRYFPVGSGAIASLSLDGLLKQSPGLYPPDRRIDPSMHSVSLADARRPDCPLIYVNRGFEHLTGYTKEECIGRNCRFLQGRETDAQSVRLIREAIAAGEPLIIDLFNYKKDGSPFANRLSLTPVRSNNGQITHVVGIQSDLTSILALQETLIGWAVELGRRPHPEELGQ